MKFVSFLTVATLVATSISCREPPTATKREANRASSSVVASEASYVVVLNAGDPRGIAASVGVTPRFVYTHAIRGFSAPLSAQAVDALEHNPMVDYVSPVVPVYLDSSGVEQHTRWALDRLDTHPRLYDSLYNFTASGQGVNAYDIDSGCRATHVEFLTNRCRDGIDFVGDGYGVSPTDDCLGHGTWTASLIGGVSFGVAKSVVIHPVRIFGCANSADNATVIAAIDWVTANAIHPAVANMSFGGTLDQALIDAAEGLVASGVFVAAAAGNNYGDACLYSPAAAPDVLTVGATDSLDRVAVFSNQGACVDLFSPGVQVTGAFNINDIVRASLDGTSASAPLATGTGALWLETHPTATPAEVTAAILSVATPSVLSVLKTGSPNALLYTLLEGGTITPPPPPPPPPSTVVASFTVQCQQLTCSFDASTSHANAGLANYEWSFGDGSRLSCATCMTPTHTYAKPGSKTVTLIVTDTNGQTAFITQNVKPSKR